MHRPEAVGAPDREQRRQPGRAPAVLECPLRQRRQVRQAVSRTRHQHQPDRPQKVNIAKKY